MIDNSYIIISSAYNEAATIRKSIESVIKQTIKPLRWFIVNDGSTDSTSLIIEQYSQTNPWIIKIDKQNDRWGIPGYHAIPNFYIAFEQAKKFKFSFVTNLDTDIIIDREDYYEYQMNQMHKNREIGICSGITYYINSSGKKQIVSHEPWHTTGAIKFYRRECLNDIQPLIADIAWDGIDEIKAMSKGWKTTTFFDLEVNHLGKLRDMERNKSTNHFFFYGRSAAMRGYPVWFIFPKFIKYCFQIGIFTGFKYWYGYVLAYIKSENKIVSKDEIDFLHRFLLKRLLNKIRFREI